MYDFFLIH